MFRYLVISLAAITMISGFGCGGGTSNNAANNRNANANIVAASPTPTIEPVAEAVPSNYNNASSNSTASAPTRNSNVSTDARKQSKPAATPASGIPSADEIRKAMGQPQASPSNSAVMKEGEPSMMMMKKKPTPTPKN